VRVKLSGQAPTERWVQEFTDTLKSRGAGYCSVVLQYKESSFAAEFALGPRFKVDPTEQLRRELLLLNGVEEVIFEGA
jgi:hypothetical protein